MSDLTGLNLPDSVVNSVEFAPMEDVGLAVLRHYLPGVRVFSLVPDSPPAKGFLMVRRAPSFGRWRGDQRFIDMAELEVTAFASDPDGDERGALIAEAARVAIRQAGDDNFHIPGAGWVIKTRMASAPSRRPDWATSTGPVQFADLPVGYWRYEARYSISIRRERR